MIPRYDGQALVTLLCSLGCQPRSPEQMRAQKRSHTLDYERGPRSRIKSFRKEYRGKLRQFLPTELVEPPLPDFFQDRVRALGDWAERMTPVPLPRDSERL
ncbi:MAG: hypothetical protein EON54_14410 [Alcaligenaceae bacterium]|nr:MAG: hypothetical protein EON54_14410 [Alcaligenaceae bacterium]